MTEGVTQGARCGDAKGEREGAGMKDRCNECALRFDARRVAVACHRCETLVCRECLEFWHPDCQERRYAP